MHRFRKWFPALLAVALYPVIVTAQTPTPVAPDCNIPIVLSAAASTNQFDNRSAGCTNWVITYTNSGFTVLALALQSSADTSGVPTSWVTFAGTVVTGINPNTAITQNSSTFAGYYPWIRVNLSGLTGTGTVRGVAYGWKTAAARAGGGGGNPTGAAAGCLAGNYPNPTIAGITIAAGVVFVGTGLCLSEDATNFNWDNTNKRLLIISPSTTAFTSPLTIRTAANLSGIRIEGGNDNVGLELTNTGGSGRSYSVLTTRGASGAGVGRLGFWDGTALAFRGVVTGAGNWILGAVYTERNYGFMVNTNASVGTMALVNPTAASGFTLVDVGWDGANVSALTTRMRHRAGTAQSTTNLHEWQTVGGVNVVAIGPTGGVQTVAQAIGSLPTCVAGLLGFDRAVNDALVPVLGNTVVAGGGAAAKVWCNGAAWTVVGI